MKETERAFGVLCLVQMFYLWKQEYNIGAPVCLALSVQLTYLLSKPNLKIA